MLGCRYWSQAPLWYWNAITYDQNTTVQMPLNINVTCLIVSGTRVTTIEFCVSVAKVTRVYTVHIRCRDRGSVLKKLRGSCRRCSNSVSVSKETLQREPASDFQETPSFQGNTLT
ncbi:hypothetical protein NDU88_006964 [Pleurodeles waltl]|uniref:Uncharacterized protein n=1 Tax=Pleurodeles waltl TaxID=8319 RepID=A0AAV7U0X9_PLEWA|nr:hypothetical protein NDU88_006964 [Pleurodeles waltl]